MLAFELEQELTRKRALADMIQMQPVKEILKYL